MLERTKEHTEKASVEKPLASSFLRAVIPQPAIATKAARAVEVADASDDFDQEIEIDSKEAPFMKKKGKEREQR